MLYLFFMICFVLAAVLLKEYYLAAAEIAVVLVLSVFAILTRRRKERMLTQYIESITYDSESAKNSTLLNFPLLTRERPEAITTTAVPPLPLKARPLHILSTSTSRASAVLSAVMSEFLKSIMRSA